jgi:thioredoxin-dependent peroxiredoxin
VLTPGTIAPSFEAELHTGDLFQLSYLRNKQHLVLYFYPKDFTYGCTREACAFRDHDDDFKSLGAVVIGVSPDSPERHREFAAQHRLDFPLISDPDHELAKLYKASLLNGLAMLRVTYVIDKQGIIRGAFHHELLIGSHWENVRRLLLELQKESL